MWLRLVERVQIFSGDQKEASVRSENAFQPAICEFRHSFEMITLRFLPASWISLYLVAAAFSVHDVCLIQEWWIFGVFGLFLATAVKTGLNHFSKPCLHWPNLILKYLQVPPNAQCRIYTGGWIFWIKSTVT